MSTHTFEVNDAGVTEVCALADLTPFAKSLADLINATTPFESLRGSWSASGPRHVTTTSSEWHLAEYGTRTSPPYAPVRNAMESLGFQSIDGSPGVVIEP